MSNLGSRAAEQRRIVKKVDELMTLVDQLEAQETRAHSLSSELLEAVVAEVTAPPPAVPRLRRLLGVP